MSKDDRDLARVVLEDLSYAEGYGMRATTVSLQRVLKLLQQEGMAAECRDEPGCYLPTRRGLLAIDPNPVYCP